MKRSRAKDYPPTLLSCSYVYDYYHTKLVFNPKHYTGKPNLRLDLRYWTGWRSIIEHLLEKNFLHEEIILNNYYECDDEFIEFMCATHRESLKLLHLLESSQLTERSMYAICTLQHLQSLSITKNQTVTDANIDLITNYLVHLNSVDLSHCGQLTNSSLIYLANKYTDRLLRFSIEGNENINFIGTNEIVMRCEELLELNIAYCTKVTFVGVVVNAKQGLLQYLGRKLKKININGCKLMETQALRWISIALVDLEQFCARDVILLDDHVIKTMLHSYKNLTHLELSYNRNISSAAVTYLSSYADRLTYLNLSNCLSDSTATSIDNLLLSLKQIEYLDVSYNKCITNAHFPERKKNLLPKLKHLDISFCVNLSTYGVACISQRCPNLQFLSLAAIDKINDSAIQAVAFTCRKLRVLQMQGCRGLSDLAIQHVMKYCKQLLELNISYDSFSGANEDKLSGEQYTDECWEWLLVRMKNLRALTACNQTSLRMTTPWLMKMFPRYRNYCLQKLIMKGCRNTSIKGMSSLLKYCWRLNDVFIPDHLIESPVFTTRKYFDQTFKHCIYIQSFNQSHVHSQSNNIRRSQALVINVKKEGVFTMKKKQEEDNIEYKKPDKYFDGYHIVQPHHNKLLMEYQDMFTRRRLTEKHAIRQIIRVYTAHRIWQRVKRDVMARRIQWTYRKHVKLTAHHNAVIKFTQEYAAKTMQRFVLRHKLQFYRASKKIQACYRGYRLRKELRMRIKLGKYATKIQSRARGMIVRISERYILAQIYLRLPLFWKKIANAVKNPFNFEYSSARGVQRYQINDLRKEATSMLSDIINKYSEKDSRGRGKLAPRLPVVIPQRFDKTPVVSMSDGKKLAFYQSHNSILSETFLETTKNKKNFELSEDAKKYLAGNFSNAVVASRKKNRVVTKDETNPTLPVHVFSAKFWPPTKVLHNEDMSTDLYNKNLNNFEVAKNSRTTLFCCWCEGRLQLIYCKTCTQGFCFHCAYQLHSTLIKHDHVMELMDPRIFDIHSISTSLIYHIDNAQHVMHELKHVMRFLRSTAELQRINQERRLLKEYEQEQEAMRIAYLQAQEKFKTKQEKATIIALLYRAFKSRKMVRQRRMQQQLESMIKRVLKFSEGVIKLQTLVRRFIARCWLYKKGFYFRGVKKYYVVKNGKKVYIKAKKIQSHHINKKGSYLTKETINERGLNERYRGMLFTRNMLIAKVQEEFNAAMQFLQANISFWRQQLIEIDPQVARAVQLRDTSYQKHRDKQASANKENLSNTAQEKEMNDKGVKTLYIRFIASDERLESLRNMRWWVFQHLRCLLRKQEILPRRFHELTERLVWIAQEYHIFDKLQTLVKQRIERITAMENELVKTMTVNDSEVKPLKAIKNNESTTTTPANIFLSMKRKKIDEIQTLDSLGDQVEALQPTKEWLQHHLEFILTHYNNLDAQQESLLKEEISLLQRDHYEHQSLDALLEELVTSLYANNSLSSEKIDLECRLVFLSYASEEGKSLNEQLITVKNKQKQLNNMTIDSLKVALQQKYDDIDKRNLLFAAFPKDSPDIMDLIELEKASKQMMLVENNNQGFNALTHHFELETFMKLYYLQPWIGPLSLQDVKIEERLEAKKIKYGALEEEIRSINAQIAQQTRIRVAAQIKIDQCTKDLEAYVDPIVMQNTMELEEQGFEEDPIARQEREGKLMTLRTTITISETNINLSIQEEAQLNAKIPNIKLDMERLTTEIKEIQEQLNHRSTIRKQSMTLFFEFEKKLFLEELPKLEDLIIATEDQVEVATQRIDFILNRIPSLEQMITSNAVIDDIPWPTFLSYHPLLLPYQQCLNNIKTRVNCNVYQYYTTTCQNFLEYNLSPQHMFLRKLLLPSLYREKQFYEQFLGNNDINNLAKAITNNTNNKGKTMTASFAISMNNIANPVVKEYLLNIQRFLHIAQIQRRARALQRSIYLRRERYLQLREARMALWRALRDKQLEEEALERKRKEDILSKRGNNLMNTAKNVKKFFRSVNEKYQELRYQQDTMMDSEEQRMAKRLKEKNKTGVLGRPMAIKSIIFKSGPQENQDFADQNDYLKEKGLPHFIKVPRAISAAAQLFIWTQTTYDDTQFITEIRLGHKDKSSEYFLGDYFLQKQLQKQKLQDDARQRRRQANGSVTSNNNNKKKREEQITHQTLYEEVSHESINLIIYVKRDEGKGKGISALETSINSHEENRMVVENYIKLEPSLASFDLPDLTLWFQSIDKDKKNDLVNTNSLIAEVTKIRHLLSQTPNDPNLKDLLIRANERLQKAYEQEQEAETTDPLTAGLEMLALDRDDMQQWIHFFQRIDKDKHGKVSLKQIFEFLDQPLTPVAAEVFNSVDGMDSQGLIEFGDFLRALGTYGFFGKEEIIKFIYVFCDKDRTGYISAAEFSHTVDLINPIEKLRARRAMGEMGLDENTTVNFDDFKLLNEKFPALFLPMFLLQDAIREKSLGVDWWFMKLTKYKQVRHKMQLEIEREVDLIDTELKKYQEDKARKDRMKAREVEIKNATGVRKALLEAQQFLDEAD